MSHSNSLNPLGKTIEETKEYPIYHHHLTDKTYVHEEIYKLKLQYQHQLRESLENAIKYYIKYCKILGNTRRYWKILGNTRKY